MEGIRLIRLVFVRGSWITKIGAETKILSWPGIKQNRDATVTQQVKISGPVAIESAITETSDGSVGGFLSANWSKLMLGLLRFYDLAARLTLTKKDNTIVTFLTNLLNAVIPNKKKDGGKL